jgi:hypothetical protein
MRLRALPAVTEIKNRSFLAITDMDQFSLLFHLKNRMLLHSQTVSQILRAITRRDTLLTPE